MNNLKKILKEEMGIPLSSANIDWALQDKVNICEYSQISNYTIDELLNPYGYCVILYDEDKYAGDVGHWVALIKRDSKLLEFFDPYGNIIDKDIASKRLYDLLVKTDYEMEYNDVKLQKLAENIATCGRWVIMRIIYRLVDVDDFAKFFTSKIFTPDEMVTLMTLLIAN